jgi:hypothetical protein
MVDEAEDSSISKIIDLISIVLANSHSWLLTLLSGLFLFIRPHGMRETQWLKP